MSGRVIFRTAPHSVQAHGVSFLLLQCPDAGTVSPAQCWSQPLAGAALPSWFWAQKPWGSCQLLLLGCHSAPGTSAWCTMWLFIFVMTCPTASTAFYVCWHLQRWNWREPSCEWAFPFPCAFLNPLFIYFFWCLSFLRIKRNKTQRKLAIASLPFFVLQNVQSTSAVQPAGFLFLFYKHGLIFIYLF